MVFCCFKSALKSVRYTLTGRLRHQLFQPASSAGKVERIVPHNCTHSLRTKFIIADHFFSYKGSIKLLSRCKRLLWNSEGLLRIERLIGRIGVQVFVQAHGHLVLFSCSWDSAECWWATMLNGDAIYFASWTFCGALVVRWLEGRHDQICHRVPHHHSLVGLQCLIFCGVRWRFCRDVHGNGCGATISSQGLRLEGEWFVSELT